MVGTRLKPFAQGEKQATQIRGCWKGIEFSDDDFTAARNAVFRDAVDLVDL